MRNVGDIKSDVLLAEAWPSLAGTLANLVTLDVMNLFFTSC